MDEEYNYYEHLCRYHGKLAHLDDMLDKIDAGVDAWRDKNIVGMKTAIAYTSGLAVSDPMLAEARTAFAKAGDMDDEDFRTVHDYAFRHAVAACQRNNQPVVIHTGFQIWGHSPLGQSNPAHLHNLLIDKRYRDVTWVLLHGGNPYVGETTYLAGMFTNVIIDFTWIAWMTPARFRLALGEWLAVVPHDRICWGSDSGDPEGVAGINSVVRHLIADITEDCIADGLIDERAALEFIENCYLNTPKRVFGV